MNLLAPAARPKHHDPERLIDRRRHRRIDVDVPALLAARRAADQQAIIDRYRPAIAT